MIEIYDDRDDFRTFKIFELYETQYNASVYIENNECIKCL